MASSDSQKGKRVDKALAAIAGVSIAVAMAGTAVGFCANAQTEEYLASALAWERQAEDFEARLAVARGQLADAEKRIAEARKGLSQRERQILAEHEVGRPGTVSRRASSWLNVKAPHDHYWKGQTGRDKHGHAVWKAPEYSLRAGALVLRSYYLRHGIKTVRGIVERFSTCNHDEYAAFLAKRLGVKEDEEINVIRRLPELIRAMAQFETGRPVPESKVATLDILASI